MTGQHTTSPKQPASFQRPPPTTNIRRSYKSLLFLLRLVQEEDQTSSTFSFLRCIFAAKPSSQVHTTTQYQTARFLLRLITVYPLILRFFLTPRQHTSAKRHTHQTRDIIQKKITSSYYYLPILTSYTYTPLFRL